MMHAAPFLSGPDWLGLTVFLATWAGYAWFSERSPWGAQGLVRTSQHFRLAWAYQLLSRENRVTDSTLIGNLMTSVSFYANTTIYIIAGLVAALGAADKLIQLTMDLPFASNGNKELLEIKLGLVLFCFVFAYFKFTWSLRQFNLLSILVGAAPHVREDHPERAQDARRLAGINSLAGDDFNRGIRAYYFGLAAAGWLISPWILAGLALTVLVVLYQRDYRSPAQAILAAHLPPIDHG